jgi:indoleacetamide hydrolase
MLFINPSTGFFEGAVKLQTEAIHGAGHAAITHGTELAQSDLRGLRFGVSRAYFWENLDDEVAKIMVATLDKLRGAGAVVVDVNFDDLTKAALAVRAVLRREGFRSDLGEFLACEYPVMTMKGVIVSVLSKRVRMLEEDARDHPPSREDVEKARTSMDALDAQYREAFRQQNIVALA